MASLCKWFGSGLLGTSFLNVSSSIVECSLWGVLQDENTLLFGNSSSNTGFVSITRGDAMEEGEKGKGMVALSVISLNISSIFSGGTFTSSAISLKRTSLSSISVSSE